MKKKTKIIKRDLSVDILRGVTVLLMVITHVIAFTYDHGNARDSIVYNVGLVGGITTFTAFLFISGVSAYYAYFKDDRFDSGKTRKILSRSFQILLVYYVLATVSLAVDRYYVTPINIWWLKYFIKTIGFLIVPEFTEFLITLALFGASFFILSKLYTFLLKIPLFGIALAFLSFALGTLIYNLDLEYQKLNLYKALIAGHDELHTFPLLQYFPILIAGLFFGKYLAKNSKFIPRLKLSLIVFVGSVTITVVSLLLHKQTNEAMFDPMPSNGRFPPSIGFLGLSTLFTIVMYVLILLLQNLREKGLVYKPIIYTGQKALSFFLIHILILLGFRYITSLPGKMHNYRVDSFLEILAAYLIVLALCFAITLLKDYIKVRFAYASINYKRFVPLSLAFLSFITLSGLVYSDFIRSNLKGGTTYSYQKVYLKKDYASAWWDDSYLYYREIESDNATQWIEFEFNHKEMIDASKASLNDLRVVAFDGTDFEDLAYILKNEGKEVASILFKNNDKGSQVKFYFYYGNAFATGYQKLTDSPPNLGLIKRVALLDVEYSHPLDLGLNAKWFLLSNDASLKRDLEFNLKSNVQLPDTLIVSYTLEGENYYNQQKISVSDKNSIGVTISTQDLKPGVYTVKCNVIALNNELKTLSTYKYPFYVSYPLYVAWTIDWEGWGVSQYDLNEMAAIADGYGIPMTHFFNARIFTKEQNFYSTISEDGAEYLTWWVLGRYQNHGEEIGMHLHMFPDMLKEVGVTPRSDAVATGAMYGDSVITAYNTEELVKVLEWGKQKFRENGLPPPVSFRAGGWMASLSLMYALEQTGFLIDSSGRTGGPINPAQSYSTKVPWNLKETTRPYAISRSDMNSWSGDRFNLWEFPNNGADSYWFSVEELKRRLDVNFTTKEKIMLYPQVLTYLSHPHWLSGVDSPKLRAAFDYSNQFLYKNDSGPIVYSTLRNAYDYWEKDKFFNGE